MDDKKREIRDILLGKVVMLPDGRLTSMGPDDLGVPAGVSDGAFSLRLFGVTRMGRYVESEFDPWTTRQKIHTALEQMGRIVFLREQPDAEAVLLRYVLTRTTILTFSYEEDGILVAAWTGRSFSTILSLTRAINSFEKHLPEGITLTEKKMAKEEKVKKEKKPKKTKEDKAREKAEKAEKAALKAKEKAEKAAAAVSDLQEKNQQSDETAQESNR
ncbi:MAG: hypothetical protein J6P72_09480 [Firmicutes bacterium]|nr:hypothetical protein [Bacillota bacterium]